MVAMVMSVVRVVRVVRVKTLTVVIVVVRGDAPLAVKDAPNRLGGVQLQRSLPLLLLGEGCWRWL
jgi:hypothetical protein